MRVRLVYLLLLDGYIYGVFPVEDDVAVVFGLRLFGVGGVLDAGVVLGFSFWLL